MREDFAKVITDQPRGRSDRRNQKTRMRLRTWDPELDEYSGPLRISGKARFTQKSAGNGRLQPLKRFLRSQIGQPWNRIWSDARHLFDARSRTQHLFLELLRREVERNCFVGEDGMIYEGRLFDGRHPKVSGFYVHPATGTLEWAESSWRSIDRSRSEHPVILIASDANTEYECGKGIWYVKTYAWYNPKEIVSQRLAGLSGTLVPVYRGELKNFPQQYVARKKQANRKELKEIQKYLADAPQLIKKLGWRKITVGYHPDLRAVLLAKDAQADDVLKRVKGALEAAG